MSSTGSAAKPRVWHEERQEMSRTGFSRFISAAPRATPTGRSAAVPVERSPPCSPCLRGENSPCAPWLIPVPPLRGDGLATVQPEQHDEVDHRQREAHDPPRECRLETGWPERSSCTP